MTEMKNYQELAARTLIDGPDFEISNQHIMLVWNAIGLAGEAGEVADIVKKGVFHQHGVDFLELKKELGDALWYIAGICTNAGFDLGEVMAENIEKLEKRYPSGYSSEDSVKRVDVSSIPIIAQGGDWYILGLNDGLVNMVLARFHKAIPEAHWSPETGEVSSEATNLKAEELEAIRDKVILEVVEELVSILKQTLLSELRRPPP